MFQMASAGNHHQFASSSSSPPLLHYHHHHHQFHIPSTSINPNLMSSPSSTSQTLIKDPNKATLLDNSSSFSPLFSDTSNKQKQHEQPNIKPSVSLSPMSATALLQKAAQMGSTRSSNTNAPSFFANAIASSSASPSSSSPTRSQMMIPHVLDPNAKNMPRPENRGLVAGGMVNSVFGSTSSGASTSNASPNQFQSQSKPHPPGPNPIQQMDLTRDFLGVSSDHHPHHQYLKQGPHPFLSQDLVRFAPLG